MQAICNRFYNKICHEVVKGIELYSCKTDKFTCGLEFNYDPT